VSRPRQTTRPGPGRRRWARCVPLGTVRALRSSWVAVVAVVSLIGLSGCGVTGTAATVGDETITIDELQGEVVEFSESFEEPLPLSGDLGAVQAEFLTRQINHLLLIELADREGIEITQADVDELYDELAGGSGGDVDALRAQFVYTEDGLRRALEDELRIRALTPVVGQVESAVADVAEQVGVEVNPRFGTWEGVRVTPGTGSISVPAG
jgi:hypothetical protein